MTRKPPPPRGSWLSLLLVCGGAVTLGACGPMESPETGELAAAPRTASSAQALVVSPELSLPPSFATGKQSNIVMASTADVTLVLWVESPSSGGPPDIQGVRVRKSDGALLDATPLCIA